MGFPHLRIENFLDDPSLFFLDFRLVWPEPEFAGTASFLRLDRQDYGAPPFLRKPFVKSTGQFELVANLQEVMRAVAESTRPVRPAHYILNTGHCASTLFARAIGALPGFFVLREPKPLDSLNLLAATADRKDPSFVAVWPRLLQTVLYFLGRTFQESETAVIKSNELIKSLTFELLEASESSKAVFLYPPLEELLIAVLKKDHWRGFNRAKLNKMKHDSESLSKWAERWESLADAEVVALVWLIEQHIHLETCTRFGASRVVSVRSDRFLANPDETLVRVSRHLGREAAPEAVRALTEGDMFNTDAKDSGREFNREIRDREYKAAARQFREEIDQGLRFAQGILAQFPIPQELPSRLI
jgi:hypothetical protein